MKDTSNMTPSFNPLDEEEYIKNLHVMNPEQDTAPSAPTASPSSDSLQDKKSSHPDSAIYDVLGDNIVADNVYNTADMLKGILSTPIKIGNDILNTGIDAVNTGLRFFDDDYGDEKKEQKLLQHNELPEAIQPQTPLGKFSQSAASWYLGGKMIDTAIAAKMTAQALTVPGTLTNTKEIGKAFTELGNIIKNPSPYKGGAIAEYTKEAIKDFILNAPEDDTLATYVKETGVLEHPFLDLMAVDDDDDMLIRRMKHSLEGFVIGTSLETTFEAGRQAVKLYKKLNGQDISETAIKRFMDEADYDYTLSTGYALRHQLTEAGYNDGQITQSMNLLESYASVNKKQGETIREYLARLDLNFIQKELDPGVHGAIELPGILSDNPINILLNIADPNAEQTQTISHELSHFFMWDTYRRAVKDGDKNALSQWDSISKALGITPEAKAVTPQQMETFANGFEIWLATGKAPVPTLAKAFESFKKQSQALALDMMDSGARINPKLREAFGKLFITKDMDDEMKALYSQGNLINEAVSDLAGVYYKDDNHMFAGDVPHGRRIRTGLINLDYTEYPDSVKNAIDRISRGLEEYLPSNIKDAHTWNQVQEESLQLFSRVMANPEKAPSEFMEAFRTGQYRETVAHVANQFIGEMTDQIHQLYTLINTANEKELLDVADNYMERYFTLRDSLAKVAIISQTEMTQAARMMNVQKKINELGAMGTVNFAAQALAQGGEHTPEEFIRQIKHIGMLGNDSEKIFKYIKHVNETPMNKIAGTINDIFTNSLLSNPATSLVNLLGNAAVTATSPLEYIIGGYLSKGYGKIKDMLGIASDTAASAGDDAIRIGSRIYTGIGLSWKDARETAQASLKNKSSIWGVKSSVGLLEYGPDRWIASGTYGLDPQSSLGRAIDAIGSFINMPSTLLMSSDDFFKSLNGRAMLFSDLWEQGITEGITDKNALIKYVSDNWEQKIFQHIKDGKLQKEVLMDERATEYALLQTFSNDRGTLVGALSKLKKAHPLLHPLIPFVRTPARLVDWTVQRTPLGLLYQQQRDILKQGGPEASKILGQWALGGMFIGSAVMLAQSGHITGGGPANPQAKKSMMDLGWQPYSIKIGDSWYSYNRLDPIGSFFGIVGDYLEITQATKDTEEDANTVMDCAQAMLLAVAKNTTSKTYLQNIGSLISIIENPDIRGSNKVSSYASQIGQGFIPRIVTNLARDTGMTDPYMKEASTFLDRIKARTPGLSGDLPLQYSWLTGEARAFGDYSLINFTPNREANDDEIHQELLSYGAKLGGPSRTIQGVRLTDEQYSRYCELHGTVTIGGRTLMDALSQLVQTSSYQSLPKGETRMKEINSVIGQYREQARYLLKREYPDMLTASSANTGSQPQSTDIQKIIDYGKL